MVHSLGHFNHIFVVVVVAFGFVFEWVPKLDL